MKTFNTDFDIYFEDISPSGKVHLEKLAEWMAMARERYFRKTCPDHLKFIENPVRMFTSNISISVIGVSEWADRVEAVLSTAKIKKISFEMHIDFLNKRTNQVIAKACQKVVFIDSSTLKFANIPSDMASVIVGYLIES